MSIFFVPPRRTGLDPRRLAARSAAVPTGIDYRRFTWPTAADRILVRRTLGLAADARVILYMGQVSERARVRDLIAALPSIRRRVPTAHLVIAGPPTRHAAWLAREAQALGVASWVTFAGQVPEAAVPAYFAMADVVARPGVCTGRPCSVLAAMAAGTPVVAAPIPGSGEPLEPYRTGLLHPLGDPGAIAWQISTLLNDRDLAARIVATARCHIRQHYDGSALRPRGAPRDVA